MTSTNDTANDIRRLLGEGSPSDVATAVSLAINHAAYKAHKLRSAEECADGQIDPQQVWLHAIGAAQEELQRLRIAIVTGKIFPEG